MNAESSEAIDKRDGRCTMRPDGFGGYEVLWSDGTVRLGHLDRESADVAVDYFRRCDRASGFDGADAGLCTCPVANEDRWDEEHDPGCPARNDDAPLEGS